MSNENALSELQNLPVPEMSEQLAALTDDDLAALRKLEAADNGGRKGALAAIDAEAKARAEKAGKGADQPVASERGAKAAAADAEAWRGENYTGPLTADQAEWRNATFKPVQVDRTK